jgi:6-phosphofructokinase 1
LNDCEGVVLFHGRELGETQKGELLKAARRTRVPELILVELPSAASPLDIDLLAAELRRLRRRDAERELRSEVVPDEALERAFKKWTPADPVRVREWTDESAEHCTREIVKLFGIAPQRDDGLPIGTPFDYEKSIIEEYVDGRGELSFKRIAEGCPRHWPRVRRDEATFPNPVPEHIIGAYRADDAEIVVDARRPTRSINETTARTTAESLTFPEAGPRRRLRYTPDDVTVAVAVSGGIAPGINAVIAGIVERHRLYANPNGLAHKPPNLRILGFRDGLKGVLHPREGHEYLTEVDVQSHAHEGGSIIGTSRVSTLLSERPDREVLATVINNLVAQGVEILYLIGGDGSMRAAHALWTTAHDRGQPLSIVAIPKTMDNDILWVWRSFGFLSAVERAREVAQQLETEARSNPRLAVIQLFGSDSGFVVSHAALGSGVCDLALVPEIPFSMPKLAEHVKRVLRQRYDARGRAKSAHGLVLMAETAIPRDAEHYLKDKDVKLDDDEQNAIRDFVAGGRRVRGQTPDALRSAGLKIVSRVLQRSIRQIPGWYWSDFRVLTNEPRHLIRAIPPSAHDVAFAQRLGALAVDNAMAGYTDFMVSQWLTEYVLVPLELVILGRKRVPRGGIFWKSVRANTRQPEHLEFTVGVVGYRDLVEEDRVRAGVDQVLETIARAFPGQPMTLVSTLDDGAERLVVRQVLRTTEPRLVVVLPVPKQHHLESLKSEESRAECELLLERAGEVTQLPPAESEDVALDHLRAYLQDRCDVIIAVGEVHSGRTAHLLQDARLSGKPVAWVRAGNGTSLGADQGKVLFWNFPVAAAPAS